MDPHLRELLKEGQGDEEVEVILKLRQGNVVPPHIRIVARFGDIATCRVRREHIPEIWELEEVVSLKAPGLVTAELEIADSEADMDAELRVSDLRRPPGLAATGQGVTIGMLDWGCALAHPNFRNDDGSTRLLALWDQSNDTAPTKASPYGYGVVFSQEAINQALTSPDPYAALGYHPGNDAHGTCVMDIAAGNGRRGGLVGVAPQADLIFVHLATRGTGWLANLGDSVRILEALHFIARQAGDRPWVVNLSLGRCGGPHTGLTLVEQGMDALLQQAPGRAAILSAGNYYDARVHAAGELRPGQARTLTWWTDRADFTPNELEVWYPGHDRLLVEVRPPVDDTVLRVPLGEQDSIQVGGSEVGRIYHRAHDPGRGDHHVDIFLDPTAPAGAWKVTLIGQDVVDGRFNAWVERDAACLQCQSRFDPADAVTYSTTGTICNGFRTIAVGAYDPHSPDQEVAPFSSTGPTADGRLRPHLVAPGRAILVARSGAQDSPTLGPGLIRKSGTSMAAPHVTGTVACMFQAAGRPLWIHETHRLLLGSTRSGPGPAEAAARIGNGYLDIEGAVEAAYRFASGQVNDEAEMTRRVGMDSIVQGVSEMEHELFESDQGDEDVIRSEYEDQELEAVNRLEWEYEERADQTDLESTEFEADLVELAEAAISAGEVSHGGGLLSHVLSEAGVADTLSPLGGHHVSTPAEVFDTFAFGARPALRHHYEQFFEVVAGPGASLQVPLRRGDVLIRRAFEGRLAHAAFLESGETIPCNELVGRGLAAEQSAPGLYTPVIEVGTHPYVYRQRLARRITDQTGRLPHYQMILRLRAPYGERDWYTEEDFTEAHTPARRWSGCNRFTADDARWAQDSVSPDYRHLSMQSRQSLPDTQLLQEQATQNNGGLIGTLRRAANVGWATSQVDRLIQQELEDFLAEFSNIWVTVRDTGPVAVHPPYFMNVWDRARIRFPRTLQRYDRAMANRRRADEATRDLLDEIGRSQRRGGMELSRALVGKSYPEDIRTILQTALDRNLIQPGRGREGEDLRDWLRRYGIGIECSGFVSQALNRVTERVQGSPLAANQRLDTRNTSARMLRGGEAGFIHIRDAAQLRPGDTMYISGHIRIITSVGRDEGGGITFTTAESTPIRGDVGPERAEWSYDNTSLQAQRSSDGRRERPTFGRYNRLQEAREQAIQRRMDYAYTRAQ